MNLKLVAVGGAQRTKWKNRYTGGVKLVHVDHFMGKGERSLTLVVGYVCTTG